jgi:hypothetical protein
MSKMASHEPFGHLKHKLGAKERLGVKLVVWLSTTKSRELTRPDPGACGRSATHRWKALKERYKFASNLTPIKGLSKELWAAKVPGIQTGTILGLPLGSPRTKSHLDVAPMEWRRIYYVEEGGGFPWVQAMVNQMSPKLPVACPSTKGAPECVLTNLLVGLM